jgi:XRE family transcriptional regulator, fatty acid utilization regulator
MTTIPTPHERIILGLKVRQLRQEAGYQFNEFSAITGMSISYLNEIEKGKKYPQPDKILKIANALNVSSAFLISPELTKGLAPVGNLLQSNFLNELPFELFGIEMSKVVEIIAEAPGKVNAFIGAIIEIARNYSLNEEHFYFAALRAWQEMHLNYFDDIEKAAAELVAKNNLLEQGFIDKNHLASLLENNFGYTIIYDGLAEFPDLESLRSVFVPKEKKLLLNPTLQSNQITYILAKELAFNVLQLTIRPHTNRHIRVDSFDEVLNNFKADYFAVAVLVNKDAFVEQLKTYFAKEKWDGGQFLLGLGAKYRVGPEVIFQRFNLMAHSFGIHKLFYVRLIHNITEDNFEIDKELHFNRRHLVHANGLREHYCRRWPPTILSKKLATTNASGIRVLADASRIIFQDTGEEYACLSIARQTGNPNQTVAALFAMEVDENLKNTIKFVSDPAIKSQFVGVTCERCTVENCLERAKPPIFVERKRERAKAEEVLLKLLS